MRRPRAVIAVALGLVALALVLAACGGGDDGEDKKATPPPSGDLGALPPGFVECMAEQGYEIKSSADIHSAPPEVLQGCFGAAH